MKEQMMHWKGSDLILTPYFCYGRLIKRIIITGVIFLLLGLYLVMRFRDFWQLPLAIGLCSSVLPWLYWIMLAGQSISIPKESGMIVFQLNFLYKKKIWKKSETELVCNSLDYMPFFAITHRDNPYGKAFPISPFLNNGKRKIFFEQEILPIIQQQLKINS